MKKLLILAFLLQLFACSGPPATPPERGPFTVAAPDLLYFRNMRQTSYRQIPAAREGVDLFVPRTWPVGGEGPGLEPQLAVNWLEDQAYIFLQPRAFAGDYAEPFNWYREKGEGVDSFAIPTFGLPEQEQLARQLVQAVSEGEQIWVRTASGERMPILQEEAERKALLVAWRDFIRLTGAGK